MDCTAQMDREGFDLRHVLVSARLCLQACHVTERDNEGVSLPPEELFTRRFGMVEIPRRAFNCWLPHPELRSAEMEIRFGLIPLR